MLLERCVPGTMLRTLPEPEQDVVMADVLHRLWRKPPESHPFRPLAAMRANWRQETWTRCDRWVDPGMHREALQLFADLPASAPEELLLATDLHAGNVLRSERLPWLVIDPKPFVGDPGVRCDAALAQLRRAAGGGPDRPCPPLCGFARNR